jgi:hypothetical protein
MPPADFEALYKAKQADLPALMRKARLRPWLQPNGPAAGPQVKKKPAPTRGAARQVLACAGAAAGGAGAEADAQAAELRALAEEVP